MKLLILGSEGFIGGHCIQHFTQRRVDVTGVDIYEQPSTAYEYIKVSRLSPEFGELLESRQFDVIINAAGSGNVPYSVSHPVLDFEANCFDVIRILDNIRKFQKQCKYLHLSSAAVYGNPDLLPVKESSRLHPVSPYGWHKLIAEKLCREYAELYNLQLAVLRPFSVYGPRLRKQIFWDLHQRISSAENSIVRLHGTGKETRDFIFIDDVMQAFDCLISAKSISGEAFNVAVGRQTTILEAAQLFASAVGATVDFEFNGVVREGDPQHWLADISSLQRFGFKPTITLNAGLKKVAEWLSSLC